MAFTRICGLVVGIFGCWRKHLTRARRIEDNELTCEETNLNVNEEGKIFLNTASNNRPGTNNREPEDNTSHNETPFSPSQICIASCDSKSINSNEERSEHCILIEHSICDVPSRPTIEELLETIKSQNEHITRRIDRMEAQKIGHEIEMTNRYTIEEVSEKLNNFESKINTIRKEMIDNFKLQHREVRRRLERVEHKINHGFF